MPPGTRHQQEEEKNKAGKTNLLERHRLNRMALMVNPSSQFMRGITSIRYSCASR
jgi:hypothetical protein